jgi:hypothetical protein
MEIIVLQDAEAFEPVAFSCCPYAKFSSYSEIFVDDEEY